MASDCCFAPSSAANWNELQKSTPVNISDLVANATLGGTTGTLTNSSTYAAPGTWIASPIVVSSSPTCVALGTDNLQNVADAAQWNFLNLTANLASSTAIPLRKVLFLRAGTKWQMKISLDFGASTYTEVQLGFLDSAATRGDAQGTFPVVDWTGSFTGVVDLYVTLRFGGAFNIGVWAKSGTNYSMFDMRWIAVVDVSSPAISIQPFQLG
ncbi:MAG: hypothetical protein JSS75_04170 [Bacteroidetes bacterium]|nr:hypothetical protein [Bacteroidota bacterium]